MTTPPESETTPEPNYREQPHLYPLELDDEAVVRVQPYAGEVLRYFRIETMEAAAESAALLYECYLRYKEAGDFVGMDVVRRLLHLGLKRARQAPSPAPVPGVPARPGPAQIFSKTYHMVGNDPDFQAMRGEFLLKR